MQYIINNTNPDLIQSRLHPVLTHSRYIVVIAIGLYDDVIQLIDMDYISYDMN